MKIFASPASWIEGAAVQQLEQAAALPGMIDPAGMPDLHPSKNCSVGAALYLQGIVYPHLVGNDFGCGYSLFATDLPAKKTKAERIADRLVGLEGEWDGDAAGFLEANAAVGMSTAGLGTVGGGNHFAELQRVHSVALPGPVSDLGLDPDQLVLLVHSGCRSLGDDLYRSVVRHCGADGLPAGSEHFEPYLLAHDAAVRWAAANRALIAQRVLGCIGATGRQTGASRLRRIIN